MSRRGAHIKTFPYILYISCISSLYIIIIQPIQQQHNNPYLNSHILFNKFTTQSQLYQVRGKVVLQDIVLSIHYGGHIKQYIVGLTIFLTLTLIFFSTTLPHSPSCTRSEARQCCRTLFSVSTIGDTSSSMLQVARFN